MNLIHHNEGALKSHECTSIINYFNQNTDKQIKGEVASNGGTVVPAWKVCKEMWFYSDKMIEKGLDGDLNKPNPFPPVARVLSETVSQYREHYPFIDELTPWTVAPTFKIQKYLPNEGYFKTHCENDGYLDGYCERRVFAWMIYLNDVEDGGETEFPHQKEKVKPTRGTCLFWPAYWTHPHHGLTSPSQEKYILTGWYIFTSWYTKQLINSLKDS